MRLAKPWISALALVALLAPLAASAGDGVVEINQARALAGAGPAYGRSSLTSPGDWT